MFRNLTTAATIILLAGCVSTATVKVDETASTEMRGRSLAIATSDRPDFAAMTAGKAMFAMVGAFAMISAGNEIIRQYDVLDPAIEIAEAIATDLAETRMVHVTGPAAPNANDDLAHLTSLHANHDYLLDVRTINWSFGYFPTDWDNYRVMYSAKLRLIDVEKRQMVAEAFCSRVPEKSADAPSHDELLADNAARLKQELGTAARHCIDELREKLL